MREPVGLAKLAHKHRFQGARERPQRVQDGVAEMRRGDFEDGGVEGEGRHGMGDERCAWNKNSRLQ